MTESMRAQVERLQAENDRLRRRELELQTLVDQGVKELRGVVRLVENWAYGPLFKKAGHLWPAGGCNAPGYVTAKRWLKNYDDNHD